MRTSNESGTLAAVATQTLLITTPPPPLDWRRRPRVANSRRKIDGDPLLGALDGALLKRQAQAEAAFFAGLVRAGKMTARVAQEAIGMEQEVRARPLEFARLHPGAPAKMVKDALRLRDAVMEHFQALLTAKRH